MVKKMKTVPAQPKEQQAPIKVVAPKNVKKKIVVYLTSLSPIEKGYSTVAF